MTQILQDQTLPPVSVSQIGSAFVVQTVVRITHHNFRSFMMGWLLPPKLFWQLFIFLNVLLIGILGIGIYRDGAPYQWENSIEPLAIGSGVIFLLCLALHIKHAPRPFQNFPIGQTVNFSKYNMAENNSELGVVLKKDIIAFTVNGINFGHCGFATNGRFLFENDTLKYMAGIGGATPQLAFPLLQRVAESNAGEGSSIYADTSAELYAFVAMLNHVHDLVVKDEPAPQPEPKAKRAKAKKPELIIEDDTPFNPMD